MNADERRFNFAVVNCSQILTLAGPGRARVGAELRELGIVENGSLIVRDGRVAAVGRDLDVAGLDVIDAGGRVLLPGFVDAHTHTVFAGTRADEYELRALGATYSEIAARGGGIRSTVRQTRAASEDELLDAARRYRGWFLRGGTTTVEAKSGYGLSPEAELKMLRVIRQLDGEGSLRYVATFLGAHECPDEHRSNRAEYVRMLMEMLPEAAKLAPFCDIFCEPNVFTVDESREILRAAQKCGMRLRLHADQFTADYGSRIAAELGAATADHLESTTESGLRALHAAGVQPVLLPASVYALGLTHYPAARTMIGMGMPVVLATDFNPGSSPTTSMPMVLSLASTHLKMTPAEAITATTINAAYSLGRGAEIGSLEVGKLADFAIHDVRDYREIAYFFGRETAWKVAIGGEICVVGG
jgi:imidazolonepropionase